MISDISGVVTALCVVDIEEDSCLDNGTKISQQYVLFAEEKDDTFDLCALPLESVRSTGLRSTVKAKSSNRPK